MTPEELAQQIKRNETLNKIKRVFKTKASENLSNEAIEKILKTIQEDIKT